MILMLLAPFINKFEKILSDKQFAVLIWILLVCFTITPMISESPVLDTYGYDIVIITLCYLLGRWLYRNKNFVSRLRHVAPFAFLVGVLIMFAIPHFIHNTRIVWYNSPVVMLTAAALFITFCNFRTGEIAIVNSIAHNTFAVYLISDHPIVRNLLYGILPIKENINDKAVISYVFLFSAVVFVVCIILEKIRLISLNRLENALLMRIIKMLRLDMLDGILSNEKR